MIWLLLCMIVCIDGHDYCIVGAGPAGLQLAYFLHKASRDYMIFERNNQSGSFFTEYPRHRRLISINKRWTGRSNDNFNERHDWNSLLSDNNKLRFHLFSHEFFPHADSMLEYLDAFARLNKLNIEYNTHIIEIRRMRNEKSRLFVLTDQAHNIYMCKVLIIATGTPLPNTPKFKGSHLAETYSDISTKSESYKGRNVLILGRGNSAFETADDIYGQSNQVHMIGRSRVRLAWSTHYVGDLRAVNNGVLDTYQLKSLDGLLEASVEDMSLERKGDKIVARFPWEMSNLTQLDNYPLRQPYDNVISCLGFKFNHTILNKLSPLLASTSKYPAIKHNFESRVEKDVFFAGTVTHSLDYRRSAGGFIHGFRYTVRTLHRLLEWRYERRAWPSVKRPMRELLNFLLQRMNEAAGPYQMFDVLCDVVIFRGTYFEYFSEFPVRLLHQFESHSGQSAGAVLVLVMQYGRDFSGPGQDTFRMDRAIADPLEAHHSNFLHPVLYFYNNLPSAADIIGQQPEWSLPKPDRLHHVLEDFMTDWTAPVTHILPLRRFLEACTQTDLKNYKVDTCLKVSLTHSSLPQSCQS